MIYKVIARIFLGGNVVSNSMCKHFIILFPNLDVSVWPQISSALAYKLFEIAGTPNKVWSVNSEPRL
jgi:hypothetical protein